jgi:uncharacterized protein DUF6247
MASPAILPNPTPVPRHIAYQEMRDPGSYYRMLARVEQVQRSGGNPDGVPFEQMQTLIRDRQDRA